MIVLAAVVPATALILLLGMDQFEARLFGSGASGEPISGTPVHQAVPVETEPPAPSALASAPPAPDERR